MTAGGRPPGASRLGAALKRALAARRWPLALAAVAFVLGAPSLASGFATEDWLFRFSATRPFRLAHLNLYDAQDVAMGVDSARRGGSLPWVTPDDFHISFWRPITSLSYHLDFRAWGFTPFLAHLQSVLWYVALVLAAAAVFRRILGKTWLAGLAGFLFAVDDAHAQAVGWIANRHVVLGALFGCLALAAHHRYRTESHRPSAVLAPVLLALGFASSEATLAALGYFVAYAALLDGGRRRWVSLVPVLLVTLGWAIGFRALGHGAVGSALYVDPLKQPLAFFAGVPERAGALLAGQLAWPHADAWHELSASGRVLLALEGWALLALLAWPLWRDKRARFFSAGLLLSLLPACATFPSDRSLFLSGLGAFGLVALWIERATRPGILAKLVAVPLLALHSVAAAATFPTRSLMMARMDADVRRASDSAYQAITAMDQRLVVVNAPDYYFCKLLQDVRWTRGLPAVPMTCMVGSLQTATLERIDPNALRVRVPAGFLERPFDRLYRDRYHPMHVGQKVFVGTASIEVTAVDAQGAPTEAVFRFMWPIGSRQLRFVVFQGGRYVPFSPPKVGQSSQVAG
jgi:hypothetical protein